MDPIAPTPPWPAMSKERVHALLTAPGGRFEMEEIEVRGVRLRTWKHGPKTLRDLFLLSQSYGEREFLVFEDDRATYHAFGSAVLTLAAAFTARGVKKGDRVAIIMRNMPEWIVSHFAALLVGAIVTPLNAWWTGQELRYGLIDSGARIAIVDDERLQRIVDHLADCPALEAVFVARSEMACDHPAVETLESLIGRMRDWSSLPRPPLPQVEIEPEDPATIFYTSGTTGSPKGAISTHRAAAVGVMNHAVAQVRAMLMAGETPPPPDPLAQPQKILLLVVPLFHVTGAFAYLGPAMASAAKVVLMRKWDAEGGMRLIEKEKVNITGGVPTIPWQLIEHPERGRYDLSSLTAITYGGAPSAPELGSHISQCFGASAGNGWGMTETSAGFCSHVGREYATKPESCGPPSPVGDLKIMSLDGQRELPPGEIGELWAKGPQVAAGYWNKPEATAQTFVDGWVKTGDLGRLDEDGYCYIVDRAKDIVIRGGENIYCIEVENVLYEHPAVMDAAIVGAPHRTLGEEPAAVVALKPGAITSEAELRSFVSERLAAFKTPVKVVFWDEILPRNANGKILKTELKKLFVSQQAGV